MNFKRLIALLFMTTVVFSISAFAQERVVTGKVTDSKDGSPLSGVTVQVKGTKNATQTAADGSFKIKVNSDGAILVLSSVGFAKQEVAASSSPISVSLVQAKASLDEVVVVGYGTVRKKDLTGAVTTVTAKDFQGGNITTPEQMIAGKVAGVSITSNSGAPGAGSTILIRGGAYLNASNDPLIVVDGVPLSTDGISGVASPLSLINSDDIESFTILKDASSTAIYGSRASNGVILITTKHGKSGKGQFHFSTSFSVGKLIKDIPVMDANTYRTFLDTISENNPSKVRTSDTSLLGTSSTDWQKQIYQTAITSNNNLSYAGSIKNIPFRLGGDFLTQTGILKTDQLQRFTGTLNLSPKFFSDHLKLEINLHASQTNSTFANTGAIGDAIGYDPTQPVYAKTPFQNDPYSGWYTKGVSTTTGADTTFYNTIAPMNPLEALMRNNNKGQVFRGFGNIQGDYKFHFLPELHFVANWGFDESKGSGSNNWVPYTFNNYFGSQSPYSQRNNNQTFQGYFNYVKTVKSIRSNINATLGYEYQDFYTVNNNYYGYYGNGDTVANTKPLYATSPAEHTIISYYSRLVYSYADKYVLQASAREDGSSRFGPLGASFGESNRWSFFPTVSVNWRINQEDFLKNSNVISDLKLRASYGITGNQDGLGNYGFQPVYSQGITSVQYQFGNNSYYTYNPDAYISNLIWEQTATTNLGIDYGFLKNRINGTVDLYDRKTKNLFVQTGIPAGSNYTNTYNVNLGNMESKGIEVALNIIPIRTKDVTWELGFNGAYDKHTVTNLTFPGLSNTSGSPAGALPVFMSPSVQNNAVGQTPFSYYLYKQVYGTNGMPIEGVYDDINRDGVINSSDLTYFKSPIPNVILGFTTSVSYKKWSASTVLRANLNNYDYNVVDANMAVANSAFGVGFLSNIPTAYFKTRFYSNQFLSNYYLENASFLKMDNLGVAYNAGNIIDKRTNLRIGFNCQNVFTITKYTGIDPEVYGGLDNNTYPHPRTYTLSLNITY